MIARVEVRTSSDSSGLFHGATVDWATELSSARFEFPTLDFSSNDMDLGHRLEVEQKSWQSKEFDFYRFDDRVDRAAEEPCATLQLLGAPEWVQSHALGVLTRCQRAMDRRNEASRCSLFDRAVHKARVVFDRGKPLGLADYRHAVDTWQWVLRLDSEASIDSQLAALFHDIERSTSETDERVEHRAADYAGFKRLHAQRGAELVDQLLGELGAPRATRERVAELVREHEESGSDRERALLNDADALSFFSLNSSGF